MSPALATLLIQLLGILSWLVGLAELLVVIAVVISWLVSFDVINIRNRTVYQIVNALEQVTGRLLYPIHRFVPSFGGLDISPLIFFILAEVLKALIRSAIVAISTSAGGVF